MASNCRDVELLTRYLVSEHLKGKDKTYLSNEQITPPLPDDLQRLKSILDSKGKVSRNSLLERIVESFLGMSSLSLTSISPPKKERNENGLLSRDKFKSSSQIIVQKSKMQLDDNFHRKSTPYKKRIDSLLSRPSTVSSPPNRRLTRPKTASPNFHRHRIKVRPSHSDGKQRSRESWIPEEIRQKMMKRDLTVAMVNFEAKETCISSIKNISQRNSNSLERSLSKEKFGIEQRKSCGLCCVRFLPVNLILAVPLKAVLDIRDSWGDKFDMEGSRRVRVNPNLRKAPACYNSTRVCAFCAQLFDRQQETYRPSFEAKEAEKERLKDLEEAAKRKVENDPLSQIEKERNAEVNELTRSLSRQKS